MIIIIIITISATLEVTILVRRRLRGLLPRGRRAARRAALPAFGEFCEPGSCCFFCAIAMEVLRRFAETTNPRNNYADKYQILACEIP